MTTKQMVAGACCAVALVVGMGNANASLLSLTGGTPLVPTGTNDVVGPGVAIVDDAILATTANNVSLDWFFWGSESGATNTLWVDGGAASNTEADNPPYPVPFPGFGSPWTTYLQAAAGNVDMYFTSNIFPGEDLTPGGGDGLKSIAFNFLNDDGSVSGSATNIVGIFLDDSGAGPDDDYDDYVGYVRASAVPIPAAVWLFGSALMGMVGIGTRRARKV